MASFLVLTLIFGIDKEPAATAAVMVWLVSFASCLACWDCRCFFTKDGPWANCGKWPGRKKEPARPLCSKKPSTRPIQEKRVRVRCPFCAHLDDKVIDSREARTGDLIRRRRECLKCNRRFTTYERIDEIPYMVIKKDGRREKFERQKILQGLLKACEKRPVPVSKLEAIVDEAEAFVSEARGARAHYHGDRRASHEPLEEAR